MRCICRTHDRRAGDPQERRKTTRDGFRSMPRESRAMVKDDVAAPVPGTSASWRWPTRWSRRVRHIRRETAVALRARRERSGRAGAVHARSSARRWVRWGCERDPSDVQSAVRDRDERHRDRAVHRAAAGLGEGAYPGSDLARADRSAGRTCSACSGIFSWPRRGVSRRDATVHYGYARAFGDATPRSASKPERVSSARAPTRSW